MLIRSKFPKFRGRISSDCQIRGGPSTKFLRAFPLIRILCERRRDGNDSRNEGKKRPDGAKRLILSRSPSGVPRYFDFCYFLICPVGHAQHLRRVHISQDKWLAGNNSGYRQIYSTPTRRSGISRTFCEHRRSRRAGGNGGKRKEKLEVSCERSH